MKALERAFAINPMSPFVARGLSRLYESVGNIEKARNVLEKCLEGLPGDKSVNGALARLFTKNTPNEGQRAEYYWRRSFTEGDSNYTSQFWYARQLYLNGKKDEAKLVFDKLHNARVSPDVRQKIRGPILGDDGTPATKQGRIERLEANYAFLSQEVGGDWIFLHRTNVAAKKWEALQKGKRIRYCIGFTYQGLGAFEVDLV